MGTLDFLELRYRVSSPRQNVTLLLQIFFKLSTTFFFFVCFHFYSSHLISSHQVDWPLNIVITEKSVVKYNKVRNYVWIYLKEINSLRAK